VLIDQDIERAARTRAPLVLLAPPGVPAEAYAASAHLRSERRDGPFLLVDGADPREHPMTHWLDQVTSPLLLAHGGTLVILDLPALPGDVQRLLARFLVDPASHDWRAAWLDAPASLDVFLIASVRETVDTLVVRDRLAEELANELGDRALPLPSLAARPEDLRSIALDHLTRLGLALRGEPVGLGDDALALLVEQPWPLNDLELERLIYQALLRCKGPVLRAEDVALLLPSEGTSPRSRRR
jgi:DNA-binding NtrC family response regulator